ncbi:MAG: sugar phosphate isomerase/epimerase [Kiritimatiellae bacterium]|nr:sugar phosphate isomerase/epimerase [Kiritimatiellia bacterium]
MVQGLPACHDDHDSRSGQLVLGCLTTVPVPEAVMRGFFFEAGPETLGKLTAEQARLTMTAHAPFDFPDGSARRGRLNVAAPDEDWRTDSLDCLQAYIRRAATVPTVRKVVLHTAPRYWSVEGILPESPAGFRRSKVGDYELMIDSFRILAALAQSLKIEIVVENNRAYYETVPSGVPFSQVDPATVPEYFGTSPEEWLAIWRDVGRENLRLCLDSSHATTYCHRFESVSERWVALWNFLQEPLAIAHVHWSDNDPAGLSGRQDQHLPVGSAGLGVEYHRAIKNLSRTGVTHLLEHPFNAGGFAAELAYIYGL